MKTPADEVRMTIRFPHDVAEAIKRLAKANDRSINGEMVRAAQEHIAWQQQQTPHKER
jgi:predicted transcriptional regulator